MEATMNAGLWVLQGVTRCRIPGGRDTEVAPAEREGRRKRRMGERLLRGTGQVDRSGGVLGAVGLVVTRWTGIVPTLTPMAAAGLITIMIGAVATHVRRQRVADAAACA